MLPRPYPAPRGIIFFPGIPVTWLSHVLAGGRMISARKGSRTEQQSAGDERPTAAARALSLILERGARVQAPAVEAYVKRLRHSHPDATPADAVTKLEKPYLAAVTASGAAVGSAAALPGIGTLTAMSAVAGETVVFLEATAVFVLAVADVDGIPAGHREARRGLVLSGRRRSRPPRRASRAARGGCPVGARGRGQPPCGRRPGRSRAHPRCL